MKTINREEAEEIFKALALEKKTYKELALKYNINYSSLCEKMKIYKKDFGLNSNEKYCASTYLRYKYKQEIIDSYLMGNSTKKIAQEYGLSDDHLIAKLLSNFGIEIRNVGYQSKTDQTLFKEIRNEIEAYSLGLITSDGNVNETYTISITLIETDLYLLEKINKDFLNNTGHILHIPKERGNSLNRLSFCGKQICQNLKQYGVIPNKSDFLIKLADNIPKNLMPHYIRGLYDGDGICAWNRPYLRIGYCGKRQEFVRDFQMFLVQELNIKENKLFNTGGCWDCSWGAKIDLEKIYNYLYKDATIFLSRKKNKIYNYLYGNTEVISQIAKG